MSHPSSPHTGWLPVFKHVRLFTPEQAQSLINQSETAGLSPATYIQHDGSERVNLEQRSTHAGYFGPGHPIYEAVLKAVQDNLEEINRNYDFELYADPKLMLRNVHVLRYDSNQEGHLRMHADTTGFTGNTDRKLSVSILLNAPCDYDGGRLRMFAGELIEAASGAGMGDAIVFPGFQYHEVTAVTRGQRYVVVAFLQGPPFR